MPITEALAIARQIAEALEAAHEKGIVHRDLKPATIKVTADGTVRVLDFGLAKALAGDGSDSDRSRVPGVTLDDTREWMIAGTVAYMSPEQAREARPPACWRRRLRRAHTAGMDARLADLNRTELQQLQAGDLMRALSAMALGRREGSGPAAYFAERWPTSVSKDLVVRAFDPERYTKAAVAAGTTSDATWAGPLTVPAALVAAFVPLVTRQSALLQLPLRRVPFATPVSTQTGDASFAWVAENKTKPISKFAFSNVRLDPAKVSGIVVLTKELARLSTPGSVPEMQNALAAGLAQFVDSRFLDPAITAIAGERPASITAGLTPVTGGTTVARDLRLPVDLDDGGAHNPAHRFRQAQAVTLRQRVELVDLLRRHPHIHAG